MKKILLLSMSLALGFCAFAQQRVAKSDIRQATVKVAKVAVGNETINPTAANFAPQTAKSVVVNRYDDISDYEAMMTTYDLQSTHFCSNRMYQLPNGSVGIVATLSHQDNQMASDRGTGYNFFNGESGEWGEMPESRIESMSTSGPTIAQWGERGEILISHSPMRCWTREIAGEGEWEYRGVLPIHPDDYPYTDDAAWPRVATSGVNHNIIHVIGNIQHQVSSDEVYNHQVYLRSEDAVNWEISYGPLADVGYESGSFSSDDYAIAANGHTVAILYTGSLTNSVWMFKSTDDGLTWNARRVWEDPYEGIDLSDPNLAYTDTLFRPMNGAIAIDNNDVVHVALNTFEMAHWAETAPGYYDYFYDLTIDGILYWNDTQEGPIADTYHEEYVGTPFEEHFANPNPHHAARLWWPDPDAPGYFRMDSDSTKWIGYIPMFEGIGWNNDLFYNEADYRQLFYGASGHPALSCDPYGNLACAFSAPNLSREDANSGKYLRSIYISYRNADEGYWYQVEDDITDPELDYMFLLSDNLFTLSVNNTVNPGEFWFGFQSDDQIGMYFGNGQYTASENIIHATKITKSMWIPAGREWYYEIENENGSITYQYMYQAGDSIINNDTAHILVKINTLYDKELYDEVTHEYVYERDGKLYWWNKTLGMFTVLYDYSAEVGDEWEIKVGSESLMMHVDAVENIEYEGRTYRMLHVSDPDDLFSGNIVCGIGHLTSFFPERLMRNEEGMRVEGLRCYWVDFKLAFKYGEEDCDAIYSDIHGVEEDVPSTPSKGLVVYPNPTNGVLFVETRHGTSLPDLTYRITNLMGQTLLTGQITSEIQQIDVTNLPEGMYFITLAGETQKFMVR
jgi:hypothetical protein